VGAGGEKKKERETGSGENRWPRPATKKKNTYKKKGNEQTPTTAKGENLLIKKSFARPRGGKERKDPVAIPEKVVRHYGKRANVDQRWGGAMRENPATPSGGESSRTSGEPGKEKGDCRPPGTGGGEKTVPSPPKTTHNWAPFQKGKVKKKTCLAVEGGLHSSQQKGGPRRH